jgi:hypothetical protein
MSKESPVLERSRLRNDKLHIGAPNLMNLRTDANYPHACLAPDSFRVFLHPSDCKHAFCEKQFHFAHVNGSR